MSIFRSQSGVKTSVVLRKQYLNSFRINGVHSETANCNGVFAESHNDIMSRCQLYYASLNTLQIPSSHYEKKKLKTSKNLLVLSKTLLLTT